MAPGGILHTVLCGWPNSEIATLIQAIRPGKTARKRKALLLEEVGALCQEPAAHRRLCDLVFAKVFRRVSATGAAQQRRRAWSAPGTCSSFLYI